MQRQGMHFEIRCYADVSTQHVEQSDLELLLDPDAPHHLANLDDCHGSFFYLFEKSQVDSFEREARAFGFSNLFIAVMRELSEQQIPYVRFDSDGGAIVGAPLGTVGFET